MPIVILNTQYRLSRVHAGGVQKQTYNKVYLLSDQGLQASGNFIEGFDAKEFIAEGDKSNWQFRKNTSLPYMSYDFDKLVCVGDQANLSTLRSKLSLFPAPCDINVRDHADIFSFKLRDVDASGGIELEAYNSNELGTDTNIRFYNRDMRTLGPQKNILSSRDRINAEIKPEAIIDPLVKIQEALLA